MTSYLTSLYLNQFYFATIFFCLHLDSLTPLARLFEIKSCRSVAVLLSPASVAGFNFEAGDRSRRHVGKCRYVQTMEEPFVRSLRANSLSWNSGSPENSRTRPTDHRRTQSTTICYDESWRSSDFHVMFVFVVNSHSSI